METQWAYSLESKRTFTEVVAAIENLVPQHQFRVLHVHDVQATLAEKGLKRGPLKIIEVCNATFAHQALQKEVSVALFMPCRLTVHVEAGHAIVTLARPSAISQILPRAGVEKLANEVEVALRKIMEMAI